LEEGALKTMLPNQTTWARPAIIEPLKGFDFDRAASAPPTISAIVWTKAQPLQENGSPQQQNLVGIAASKRWNEREKDLAKMRSFEADWDGFAAEAPNLCLIDKAEFFLRVLRGRYPDNPPMRAVLSADGCVAFEWANDEKFVQAEIIDPKRVEWMFAMPGQDAQFSIEFLEVQSQEQAWQPAPTAVDEPAYAFAR